MKPRRIVANEGVRERTRPDRRSDTLQQSTAGHARHCAPGRGTLWLVCTTRSGNQATPTTGGHSSDSPALEENVRAIKRWEHATLLARSKAEQVSDSIASTAGSGPVLVLHVLWFGVWVIVNTNVIRRLRPFDAFPFPFLTMTVSLEAIFLALSSSRARNRLARQSDKRTHLNLQIDLLAEREMTAVLQMLKDITRHLDVQTTVTPEQLEDLMKKTDLRGLTNRMEELAEPATSSASKPA